MVSSIIELGISSVSLMKWTCMKLSSDHSALQEANAKLEAANGDLTVRLEEAAASASSEPGSSDSSELKVFLSSHPVTLPAQFLKGSAVKHCNCSRLCEVPLPFNN